MSVMMEDQTYDVLIVGLGPAGITAAIYAARKKLHVLIIGDLPGGEVRNSGEIENWPGSGETDGNSLADSLMSHLKLHTEDVTIKSDQVSKIAKSGKIFVATTKQGKNYSGKTIIYTAGRHPRKLMVPGEDQYKNLGVSYCATCDGPLFADKEVAVIGGGNSGAEAVIMLLKIAKKIYLLHIDDTLPADPILVRNFEHHEKVEIIYGASTTNISGETLVSSLTYKGKDGQEKELPVQGIFVTIGAIPNTEPLAELGVELNKFKAIVADRYGKTSLDGFFAAGDVTDIRDAQIVIAAGHGCSAALSAGDYLNRQQG